MAKEPAEDEGGITAPRETADFVGHDGAENELLDAVAGGRLPATEKDCCVISWSRATRRGTSTAGGTTT